MKNESVPFLLSKFSSCVRVLLFLLLLSSNAFALKLEGPLIFSMSGSGRASVGKGVEYHLLNPALFVFSRSTQASGFYMFDQENSYWGISLSENRTLPLALSWIQKKNSEKRILVLSTAGFVTSGWAIGLSVVRQVQAEGIADWNAKAGFLIRPKNSLISLGANWDYFLPLKKNFIGEKNLGIGLHYKASPWLQLNLDGMYKMEQKKWYLSLGTQGVLSKIFVIRLSSEWDAHEQKILYSGGLGLKAKQIQADYSIGKREDSRWLQGVNIRANF